MSQRDDLGGPSDRAAYLAASLHTTVRVYRGPEEGHEVIEYSMISGQWWGYRRREQGEEHFTRIADGDATAKEVRQEILKEFDVRE